MQNLANTKTVSLITASGYVSSVTTAINSSFDTLGFEEAYVFLDAPINSSSASLSANIQTSDTNGSFTDVAGTGLAYALPGKGQGLYGWYLDLRGVTGYKRWINLQVALGYSVTGTQNLSAEAILGRPSIGVYQNGTGTTLGVNGLQQSFAG